MSSCGKSCSPNASLARITRCDVSVDPTVHRFLVCYVSDLCKQHALLTDESEQ